MSKKRYNRSLFIFRRDLRLEDNTGLLAACDQSQEVIPVLIFDPRQADEANNEYFSQNAFRFMCDSLLELDEHLKNRSSKLHVLEGEPSHVLPEIIKENDIDAVFLNRDYTPFAKERDEELHNVCERAETNVQFAHDLYLTVPGEILTNDGGPYKVFTPFEKKAREQDVSKPHQNNYSNMIRIRGDKVSGIEKVEEYHPGKNEQIVQQGGRGNALQTLRNLERFSNYESDRDTPSKKGTTRMSAHLKFGTVSVREVYWAIRDALGGSTQLVSELYWRDFYGHVLYHFPEVLGENYLDKYKDGIDWENDKGQFEAWKEGETGFPIVDAGMRELQNTGWMHNRVRMIVASFLTKDLRIDWRWGEKWFAQNLVDYDVASNNGGWQWAAGTGTDAQPYFRIFNPWSQGEKHDPNCEYIKKWVPELEGVEAKRIHKIGDKGVPDGVEYPEPIVDHSEAREKTLAMYKRAAR